MHNIIKSSAAVPKIAPHVCKSIALLPHVVMAGVGRSERGANT